MGGERMVASAGMVRYLKREMQDEYDVVILGGAFSGSTCAVLLKREMPELRVAIVEKSLHFDRKVGEATTEVSGCFLTKRLGLAHHLTHHHIQKQGLRFWFNNKPDDKFEDVGELGSYYQVRLPSYQVDREVLDAYLLELAMKQGADLLRPAKTVGVELDESGGRSAVEVEQDGVRRKLTARWVIDASGRAAVLTRKLGLLKPVPEHPTNAMWARFRNVQDWDSYEFRERFPEYARTCQTSRAAATNHLTGYGWWCWIIPLKGGDYSAGLVYDSRLYTPPEGAKIEDRLKAHLLANPVGRELFENSEAIPGDSRAYSSLPYVADKIAGPGWQIVGDAAGFMDPLYSQGLDYCSWTVSCAAERILAESKGMAVDYDDINKRFGMSYRGWFEAIYKDKYYYLGDAELMGTAFMLDLALFFIGPVRDLCGNPRRGLSRFPFDGPVDGAIGKFMKFYNKRLSIIAQKRKAAGVYGASNLGTRMLVGNFEPTFMIRKNLFKGLRMWLKAEWKSKGLAMPKTSEAPMKQPAAAVAGAN